MTRTTITTAALAAALLAAAGPALAAKGSSKTPKRFDGTWSVEVITEKGTCDRAYRYGIVIENGQARYAGGNDFTVTGRVQGSGAVRAVISRGDAAARVVGRLAEGYGNGTWTTDGSTTCSGRWNAERRG
ncbi:hypothetical protein [uncultured Methylobacterium sp.]|jgi:hypothetical protein|uniref:hypothetical protein n=1 Tax=uncultured Methylobacterium sp. TaxID=157278 RepID=UPI00261BC3FB|nr:hypothetical protein [uncultured Methylobacterium sp.]